MTAINYYSSGDPSPREYFEWASKFNNSVTQTIIKQIKELVPTRNFTGKTMIDIGSGPGNSILSMLEEFPFKKCIAIDGAVPMLSFIEEHRHLFKKAEIEMQCKNLITENISVQSKTVDLAICCNTLKYTEKIDNIFSEVSRVLRPGGLYGFDIATYRRSPLQNISASIEGLMMHCHNDYLLRKKQRDYSFVVVSSKEIESWHDTKRNLEFSERVMLLQKV